MNDKPTVSELMDSTHPKWTPNEVARYAKVLGYYIAAWTVRRHKKGQQVANVYRPLYCKIFSRTEQEINFGGKEK